MVAAFFLAQPTERERVAEVRDELELPSTTGKFARNASNAGGVAFKNSLGALVVPPPINATLEAVTVLETAGSPGADGTEKNPKLQTDESRSGKRKKCQVNNHKITAHQTFAVDHKSTS